MDELPQIDFEAINTYCAVLFAYLDGYVPLRLIGEKGTANTKVTPEFHRPQDIATKIGRIAPQSAARQEAIYVVPCTVARPGRAKEHDIVATGVLVIDIDTGDTDAKRDHLIRYLGKPTMIVASGGITDEGNTKYHLYWRLSEAAEGADLKLAVHLRSLMASKVGGDDSFDNVTQPIRVAGTIHGKHGVLASVRLLSHEQVEYHLADLAAAVEAMPPIAAANAKHDYNDSKPQSRSAEDLMTAFIREGGKDGETRYLTLSKIIGHWLRMVRTSRATLEEAWNAVQQQNAATIQPPWPEERLLREFTALLRLDCEKHGPMPGQKPDEGEDAAPEFSDDALVQLFVREFGRDWIHVAVWGQWFHWKGIVWKRDTVSAVVHAVRLVCASLQVGHINRDGLLLGAS